MTSTPAQGLPRIAKWLIYVVITGLVAVLIWTQLPRAPYSTDLSRIGQGRPALVLAYDIKSMGGMEVMAMMDSLRPAYEDRVHFLVAPLGAPHGFAFGERHDAVNGTVVLFTAAGVAFRSVHQPADTAALQHELDSVLKLPPRN